MKRLRSFIDEHPGYIRGYVPAVVTLSLVVQVWSVVFR